MSRINIWFFITMLLIILLLMLSLIATFLVPLVVSLVVVSIFYPLFLYIKNKNIFSEKLSAFSSILIIMFIIVTPFLVFFISLAQELNYFLDLYKFSTDDGILEYIKSNLFIIQNYLQNININIPQEKLTSFLFSISKKASKELYSGATLLIGNLTSLLFSSFLSMILVYVFFIYGSTIKKFIMDLVPLPHEEQYRLITRFKELAFAIFAGSTLISLLEGVIGGALCYFFNVSGAIIWGALMAVFSFLPLVGPGIIILSISIYLFVQNHAIYAGLFLLINAIQVFLLETIAKPKIIGNKSHMNEILVFLAIIAGVDLFGMLGLFYGPLIVTIFLTLATLYKEHYFKYLQ